MRQEHAQRNHTLLALRAFLRLELHWLRTGVSWYEAKTAIVRDAIRQYEPALVQGFIPKLAVETPNVGILSGSTRIDEVQLCSSYTLDIAISMLSSTNTWGRAVR